MNQETKETLVNILRMIALMVYLIGAVTGTVVSLMYNMASGLMALCAFLFGVPVVAKILKDFISCI